jgi:NADPH-dependent glutamate synthase beta subunit-like oxidoreductase
MERESMSFKLLKEEVIDVGLCQGCAKCAGSCKHLEMYQLKPCIKDNDFCIMEKDGLDCGLCYKACPQVAQLPFLWREPAAMYSLKTTDPGIAKHAANGGFVSTMNKMLLQDGTVSHVVATKNVDGTPAAEAITDPEAVVEFSGTSYGRSGVIGKLVATMGQPHEAVAVVGVPCEIRGAAEMEERMHALVYRLGLFCNAAMRNEKTDAGDACSPCAVSCPAGVNAREYIHCIREGKYQEAMDTIREENPFPSICGRVCTHECEYGCTAIAYKDPIPVRELKKFVSEWEMKNAPKINEAHPMPTGKMVAIIGGGPAGLSCAYYLAKMGYRPTVFEKADTLGGMMRAGIPKFRLPDEILDYDVETIKSQGVDVKLNTTIGGDLTFDDLRNQGFEAIFLGIGTWVPKTFKVPGEDSQGVTTAVNFLMNRKYRYWENQEEFKGKSIYIMGGGPVAVDVAETAIRLGVKKVYLAEIRNEQELKLVIDDIPADEWQYLEYLFSTNTAEFEPTSEGGIAVHCNKVPLAPPYEKIPGSEFALDVDSVVIAVGQTVDYNDIDAAAGSEQLARVKDRIQIDELTYETSIPGVFAGGDAVARSKGAVVASVAHGKEAALSIDRYLRGVDLKEDRIKKARSFMDAPIKPPKARSRKPLSLKEQTVDLFLNFDEVDGMFDLEQAVKEAKRCLSCNSFCSHCQDFAGIFADISAGEIGSEKSYSTVIAWTQRGKELVDKAIDRGLFEIGTLDQDAITKVVDFKAKRKLHDFEKTPRQGILDYIKEHGPATIGVLSKELKLVPKKTRYEALRLTQERMLEMRIDEGATEPVFTIVQE